MYNVEPAAGRRAKSPADAGGHDPVLLGMAVASLTPRQQHLIAVLGETDSMAEAAARLCVHPSGLAAKLRAISHRLGLPGTSALVALARRHQVLDACSQAIFGMDRTGRCVFANARAAELLGYDRDALVGRNLHPLIHSQHLDGTSISPEDCPLQQVAIGTNSSPIGEAVFWHRDRRPVWIAYSATVVDEPDERDVTVITVQDITSAIHSQRELSLSNARLDVTLQAAGVAAFQIDLRTGQMVGWGELLPLTSGIDFEDFLARVHPDDRDKLSLDAARALPAGMVKESEFLLADADGKWHFVNARLRSLPGDSGEPALLVGAAVDVTANRDAQHIRAAVLDIAADAFVGTDSSCRVVEWNSAAERTFGFSRDEALGRRLEELIVPARYLDLYRQALGQLLASTTQDAVTRGPVELVARCADDREIPVEVSVTAVPTINNGTALRAFVRDISERKAAESQLLAYAITDELTGLPNRALLEDRLERSVARLADSASSVAVMLLDIDRFKLVNDSLGHPCGDVLLRHVGELLVGVVSGNDTVARFGGDTFAVVCEDVDEAQAIHLAESILETLAAPAEVCGHPIPVSVSIGVVVTDDMAADIRQLLSAADAAMFVAKGKGRGRIELSDQDARRRSLARLRLETDLRRAIAGGEMRVVYQPIVDLATEVMIGAEALVRWHHPERGLLPPSEFIPLAEESGLIVPLGEWVLRTSCSQLARWPASDAFRLTVNLAARQVGRPHTVEAVAAIIEESGVSPSQICLEITETALMEDTATATVTLERLYDLGVNFAVDDFGTGYSSLLRLRRFPVKTLKIDRLFVSGVSRNPDDRAIILATCDLARALGLVALAEGVERQEQLTALRSLGCQLGQGYLWSPPLSAEDISGILSSGAPLRNCTTSESHRHASPIAALRP